MKNKPEVKKIDKRSKEYRDAHKKSKAVKLKVFRSKDEEIATYTSSVDPVKSSSISDQVKELQAGIICLNDLTDKLLSRISQLETKVG